MTDERRMWRPRDMGWVILVLGLGVTTASAACMSDQSPREIAEGRLSIASRTDAAGRPEKPYILTLAKPACLTAKDPDDSVESTRTIHIFSTQDKVHARIARFVGKTVLVRGQPFAAHTAHHHAPIVMDISEIDAH
jgi:uncharacterized protein DUF4431